MGIGDVIARLSARQREIVELACIRGYSTDEIGRALGITFNTAKNHKGAIRERCGAQTMEQVCRHYGRWEMAAALFGASTLQTAHDPELPHATIIPANLPRREERTA